VINKVREVLQESSPEDQKAFEAMIEDDRCGFCLMQNTLGDVSLVTGESTPRVLREMKQAMAAEVTQQKDQEIERQRQSYEQRLQAEAESRRDQVAEVSKQVEEVTGRLERATEEVEAERARGHELARRLAAIEAQQRSDI
jgi:peptidoglycan hydrolase CwlO-like protein